MCVLGLALSVSLRRKGFSKIGMLVQFIGPVLFALIFIIASTFYIYDDVLMLYNKEYTNDYDCLSSMYL